MLKIKKLDRFVLKSYGLLFVATFFICLFIFMMQFLWRYVDDLVGKGLEFSVLGQFFFYAALTLIPLSLPLAILLASLITFGNFGERFELLAMKAAGISLFKIIRPLIVFTVILCGISFVFQNNISPNAFRQLTTLIISIRQKSPEVDIPEGVFYDEIDGYNIFVERKDRETGLLFDVTIYQLTGGVENARIIKADTAKIELTEDKKSLFLHLYSGELFENVSQPGQNSKNIPYRRESFAAKHALIEFDTNFNMADASIMDKQSNTKDFKSLQHAIDSMTIQNDSVGLTNFSKAQSMTFSIRNTLSGVDSMRVAQSPVTMYNVDSLYNISTLKKKQTILNIAKRETENLTGEWSFQEYEVNNTDLQIRRYQIAWHEKITLTVSCLIFFFIGAPLGAIIRKGGLGTPVVISVLIFIIYYIINTMGTKMAREDEWVPWFGMWLSTFILAPIGGFLTYKSNKDSVILDSDLYMHWIKRTLGIRPTRHIAKKEVVIDNPNYTLCSSKLKQLSSKFKNYIESHRLLRLPNYFTLWFGYSKTETIAENIDDLELIIEELSNSEYFEVIQGINKYPIIPHRAHTRPFEQKWINYSFAIIAPIGLFFYFRVWIFRRRLAKDLEKVIKVNNELITFIDNNK